MNAGEKGLQDPGPKMEEHVTSAIATPPEAKSSGSAVTVSKIATVPTPERSSGTESSRPEQVPQKPRRSAIAGAKRLVCKRCNHFLLEIKSLDFELVTICHRCKAENYFACQGLK